MNYLKKTIRYTFITSLIFAVFACSKNPLDQPETPNAPYVLSLGITANGSTTYYVVSTDDLMHGTINAVGKGIEQNGYHDYEQGNQTVFCIGGLGVTQTTGIVRDASGYLQEKGSFAFNQSLSEFTQIDNSTMLGMEIPSNAASGDQITFYIVDINSVSIKQKVMTPIAPLAEVEWPSITGLSMNKNKVYVTYFQMSPTTYQTPYTDTTYVAVYSYPTMKLDTIMKDVRTGPAGSWAAHNGIIQTETGDLYVMSNSALSNGYSQSTKHAAFLRIPSGTTQFDNYYFDFEAKSGGLKPAHIKYIGNGLVFAEVSTLNPQTADDRWTDKSLKCSIIDLNKQTITDIPEIPIHNGNGGRRFTAMLDNGIVYYPISTLDGTYIYRIDPQSATAERGAKISTTFVGGLFKMDK